MSLCRYRGKGFCQGRAGEGRAPLTAACPNTPARAPVCPLKVLTMFRLPHLLSECSLGTLSWDSTIDTDPEPSQSPWT